MLYQLTSGRILNEKIRALQEELENKSILLKESVTAKFNTQNLYFFNFNEYSKLKFVFYQNNSEGNRLVEKILETVLSDNSVASVLQQDNFYVWMSPNKDYIDIRRTDESNAYEHCDIFGIL